MCSEPEKSRKNTKALECLSSADKWKLDTVAPLCLRLVSALYYKFISCFFFFGSDLIIVFTFLKFAKVPPR